jgi:hypothetical protein
LVPVPLAFPPFRFDSASLPFSDEPFLHLTSKEGFSAVESAFLQGLPPPSFPSCQGEADKQPLSATPYGGFM